MARVTNTEIADALERVAELLAVQGATSYRVLAYRRAARTVRQRVEPLWELEVREGRRGLEAIAGVGKSIAAAIQELLRTGHLRMLDRLEGEVSADDLFAAIPGLGRVLAARIHGELGIDTLEELEVAAHDGRLEGLPGFGTRRVQLLRNELATLLRNRSHARRRAARPERPSVATLLAVDASYRQGAKAGTLHRIAPRRFNPDGRAWLPVLHTERDGWSLHAMFSNTALAHRLGRTDDWVVVYAERDGEDDRCTVVTERSGPLVGRRVVRGREAECARVYGVAPPGAPLNAA